MDTRTNEALALLAGVGIGAAFMYFVDPHRGKARRAQLRDETAGTLRDVGRDLEVARRDLRNRTYGVKAELQNRLKDEPVPDAQLVERVRAELGHHVDSIGRLEVTAAEGAVTLSGSIPADQHDEVVDTVRHVRGVARVHDQTGGVHMADEKRQQPVEDIPDDWKRPGGPADYSEGGGTGLEPQPGDEEIGGGVSGSDEDPIGEPGMPDEASFDPDAWRSR